MVGSISIIVWSGLDHLEFSFGFSFLFVISILIACPVDVDPIRCSVSNPRVFVGMEGGKLD